MKRGNISTELLDDLVIELERNLLRLERSHFYERARTEFRFILREYKEDLTQQGLRPELIKNKVLSYEEKYKSITGEL